jgi:hypothetical protein
MCRKKLYNLKSFKIIAMVQCIIEMYITFEGEIDVSKRVDAD